MAKSITFIIISFVHDLVRRSVPEMANNSFCKVKLEHLLRMTSGLKFNESYYNFFGKVATFYYGLGVRKSTENFMVQAEPGIRFSYASGNT